MSSFEADRQITGNGIRLSYADIGSGPAVVLVHGNGEDHHLFLREIPRLLEMGYRVIAPDSRGHGTSGPVSECHYADMAEDIRALIVALGLEKPYYYGHSDGGIIGLLLEMTHPGTLGKMAVSGANLSPAGLTPECFAEISAENEREPSPLLELMLTEPDIDPAALAAIRIPVLVTVGEFDVILPEETRRIVDHLPNGQLVVVPGEDHGSYVADKEIMNDLLASFFGKASESLREEKKRELFARQKATLDLFLEKGALSSEQYEKSLRGLTEKMGLEMDKPAE